MSGRKQIEKALRRAERRDGKRRTKMRVSGKSALKLSQLLNRSGRG